MLKKAKEYRKKKPNRPGKLKKLDNFYNLIFKMNRYNFNTIEAKWQKYWEDNNTFQCKTDKTKKKFYCLEMFPYPSGKFTWAM